MSAFINEWPYSNFHELNLNWILRKMLEMESEYSEFIQINSIKYADPLKWSIVSQYAQNTVVVDDQGNAYLSVQAVPSGVTLDKTSYWTKIGNFDALWTTIRNAITPNDDQYSSTTTAARNLNDLVWLSDDQLVRITEAMTVGTAYVIGTNCELTSIDNELSRLRTETATTNEAVQIINVAAYGIDPGNIDADTLAKVDDGTKGLFFPAGNYNFAANYEFKAPCVSGVVDTIFTGSAVLTFKNCEVNKISFNMTDKSVASYGKSRFVSCIFDAVNFAANSTSPLLTLMTAQNVTDAVYIGGCEFLGRSLAYMGIWADGYSLNSIQNGSLTIEGCLITYCVLNGIFSSAWHTNINDNEIYANHVQSQPTGGGQIDIKTTLVNCCANVTSCNINAGSNTATSGIETEGACTLVINGGTINNGNASAYCIAAQGNSYVTACGTTMNNTNGYGVLNTGDKPVTLLGCFFFNSDNRYESSSKVTEIATKND